MDGERKYLCEFLEVKVSMIDDDGIDDVDDDDDDDMMMMMMTSTG
jgi:hypothetical protein